MSDPVRDFEERNRERVAAMASDATLGDVTREWFTRASKHEYSYHFQWMGRPIIQFPQDIVAAQEIIWRTRPDLVIETGIAHGGSLVFYASMLELLGGEGRVLGVDIDIRPHNRAAIEAHPMKKRIDMIEGSSVDEAVVVRVRETAARHERVLVVLDSNHTHEHVLRELRLYSPMVTPGSYLLAFDTIIEDMPPDFSADRPWAPGNNPKTAVSEFLKETDRFEIDHEIESKLLITVAPGGYLRRKR
jgi:cephalosporin hydroxylase